MKIKIGDDILEFSDSRIKVESLMSFDIYGGSTIVIFLFYSYQHGLTVFWDKIVLYAILNIVMCFLLSKIRDTVIFDFDSLRYRTYISFWKFKIMDVIIELDDTFDFFIEEYHSGTDSTASTHYEILLTNNNEVYSLIIAKSILDLKKIRGLNIPYLNTVFNKYSYL